MIDPAPSAPIEASSASPDASPAAVPGLPAASGSPWQAIDLSERVRLLDETRAAIGAAREDLARIGGTENKNGTGYSLGATGAAAFARTLAAALQNRGGASSLGKRSRETIVRRTFRDSLARPGLSLRVIERARPVAHEEPSGATSSVLYSDAIAPAILINLALREGLVHGRTSTLVVSPQGADAMGRALSPLVQKSLVEIVAGSADDVARAVAESKERRVAIVASPKVRASIADSAGARPVLGFSSRGPSVIVIVPFLYGRDELVALAERVAAELCAPAAPTRGVTLVIARDWLQKKVFRGILRELLKQEPDPPSDDDDSARLEAFRARSTDRAAWPVLSPENATLLEARGLPVVTELERPSDDPLEFLTQIEPALAELGSPSDAPVHLLSIFAHPMLHERPAFDAALRGLLERADLPVIAVGTLASLAWTLGGLPVGPFDARMQNGFLLDETSRIVIEAPPRSRAQRGPRALARQAQFEVAPSLGAALLLGLRSYF